MDEKRINLALQGGGAHGAFTWGVVERLLEEDWLSIAAISGTSAGALNGAALKAGLALGGRRGRRAACENLSYIWSEVGEVSDNRMIRWMYSMMPVPRGFQRLAEMFSPFAWLDGLTRLVGPYDYGPFYANPLAPILSGMPHPDFAAAAGPELHIAATNVRSGQLRVFSAGDLSLDAVLASACLPNLFRAVEIPDSETGEVEAYWDGGYSGNPALFPLFRAHLPRDIVIVNINPLEREDVPRSPAEIADRINEISFNSSLLRELRAIRFVKRLFAEDRLKGRPMKNVLVHMILDDALMNDLTARSKLMPAPGLTQRMRQAGQAAADHFIEAHADALNTRDTVDLDLLFG